MQVRTAFLTAPAEFAFDLPDWLRPEPEALTVVNAFNGERSLAYIPSWLDNGSSEPWTHLYNVDSDGVTVSLYERTDPPPQLYAVWQLGAGKLKTFLNEPTVSVHALEAVVAGIAVSDEGLIPRIQLKPPLQRATRNGAEYEDRLTFFRAGPGEQPEIVTFTHRPGMRLSSASTSELDGRAYVSKMVKSGVRLTCEGPAGAVARLRQAVDELGATVR